MERVERTSMHEAERDGSGLCGEREMERELGEARPFPKYQTYKLSRSNGVVCAVRRPFRTVPSSRECLHKTHLPLATKQPSFYGGTPACHYFVQRVTPNHVGTVSRPPGDWAAAGISTQGHAGLRRISGATNAARCDLSSSSVCRAGNSTRRETCP